MVWWKKRLYFVRLLLQEKLRISHFKAGKKAEYGGQGMALSVSHNTHTWLYNALPYSQHTHTLKAVSQPMGSSLANIPSCAVGHVQTVPSI